MLLRGVAPLTSAVNLGGQSARSIVAAGANRALSTVGTSGLGPVRPWREETLKVIRVEPDLTIVPTPGPRAPIDFNKLTFSLNVGPVMAVATETKSGWGPIQMVPSGDVLFDPMATVFHYGSAGFEGQACVLDHKGIPRIWDPRANATRFASTCTKLGVTPLPVDDFVGANRDVIVANKSMIPTTEQGSLYLRFFVVGSGAGIGVKVSDQHRLFGLVNPVGSYFPGGLRAISLLATGAYPRAAEKGAGAFKVGGNYSNSFEASGAAKKSGYDEELYLRADRNTIDEAGAANFVLAYEDRGQVTLVSPESPSILPGTTLKRVITLATEELGYKVVRRAPTLKEIGELVSSGVRTESFCTGTAARVAPIGRIRDEVNGRDLVFGDGQVGPIAQ
ncbi:hypothetical protein EBR96_04410, partial [bacterium]|nr:hypothetical protein [bacterium]